MKDQRNIIIANALNVLKETGCRKHRAAAGITRRTGAVAVVVSESTGKVTIFENGRIVAILEPLISRRMA